MNPKDDAREFQSILFSVYELYGKPNPDDKIISLWWSALADWTLREVSAAFTAYIKFSDEGHFVPKPASIIKILQGGDSGSRAMLAWSSVVVAQQRAGRYRSVEFSDLRIHAVLIDMGGWEEICRRTTDKDAPFVQKEFVERYRGYQTRPLPPTTPNRLMGITEVDRARFSLSISRDDVFKLACASADDNSALLLGGSDERPALEKS